MDPSTMLVDAMWLVHDGRAEGYAEVEDVLGQISRPCSVSSSIFHKQSKRLFFRMIGA